MTTMKKPKRIIEHKQLEELAYIPTLPHEELYEDDP
jgi:hypothetical protein